MFEWFGTREIRDVAERAYEEATGSRHPAIGTGHLLLGAAQVTRAVGAALAACGTDVAGVRAALAASIESRATHPDAAALRSIGIELDAVREQVEAAFGQGALERTRAAGWRGGKGTHFGPEAKQALELGARAAAARGERPLGGVHVVLGLCAVRDPLLVDTLARAGTTPDALETAVLSEADRRATGT